MKNTRSQNSRDEGLRKRLNEYEVTPPSYVWDNINDRLQESRPNKRNRFFYYLLPLAACIAAAVVYFAVIQPEGNSGILTNANEQVKTKSPDIKALESGKSIEVERNLALSKENTEDIAANNDDAYTKEMASPNSELGRGSVNVASIEMKKNEEVAQNIAGNSKGFINPNTSSLMILLMILLIRCLLFC